MIERKVSASGGVGLTGTTQKLYNGLTLGRGGTIRRAG
jgi:hypothetical protein